MKSSAKQCAHNVLHKRNVLCKHLFSCQDGKGEGIFAMSVDKTQWQTTAATIGEHLLHWGCVQNKTDH